MRQLSTIKIISMFALFIALSNLSHGQYQGPATTDKIYTVKEVKSDASKLDRMDALVKVQGFIIKQINKDTYEFKDNTGTILIDIDKKKLPARPFDHKTEVIIIGEVDYDVLEPVEIEVEEIHFVNDN